MALHYFHCTDGVDLVIDRIGRDLSDDATVARAAIETADALMSHLPAYDEWANWSVYVYDQSGEVGILPFSTGGRMAA